MTGTRISLPPSSSSALPRTGSNNVCRFSAPLYRSSSLVSSSESGFVHHVRFINVNGRRDARCSQWPLSWRVSVSFFIYLIKGLLPWTRRCTDSFDFFPFFFFFFLLSLFFHFLIRVFAIFINTAVYTRNGDVVKRGHTFLIGGGARWMVFGGSGGGCDFFFILIIRWFRATIGKYVNKYLCKFISRI